VSDIGPSFPRRKRSLLKGAMTPSEDLLQRVRAEYLEMPGLLLTAAQVQRLCGIEATMCQLVLKSLVTAKFLRVKSDGRYARWIWGHVATAVCGRSHGTVPQ
jgi:hypothetical protein